MHGTKVETFSAHLRVATFFHAQKKREEGKKEKVDSMSVSSPLQKMTFTAFHGSTESKLLGQATAKWSSVSQIESGSKLALNFAHKSHTESCLVPKLGLSLQKANWQVLLNSSLELFLLHLIGPVLWFLKF